MVIRNKHGWTTIIEVFVSILLIAGIMAVVINSNEIQKPKISEQIYKEQAQILKVIQMDDNLRKNVLDGNSTNDNEIEDTLKEIIPDYLGCNLDNIPANLENKEIYAKSILITTDMEKYEPKELKLFCWEK